MELAKATRDLAALATAKQEYSKALEAKREADAHLHYATEEMVKVLVDQKMYHCLSPRLGMIHHMLNR